MSEIREFTLPDLGEGLEDAELVRWHVEVGDEVDLNDAVVEVETAKAAVDVPSPFAGRVVERLGAVGDTVAVGTVLVRIEVADSPGPAAPADPASAAPAAAATAPTNALEADEEPQPLVGYGQAATSSRRRRRRAAPGEAAPGEAAAGAAAAGEAAMGEAAPGEAAPQAARPLAKPPVRKLAKDLGVDLAALAPGSGPQGSITRAEVQAAAAAPFDAAASGSPAAPTPATAPGSPAAPRPAASPTPSAAPTPGEKPVPGFRGRRPGEVEPIRGVRRRIVEKMERSRREIPEATCSRDADLTALWELRHQLTAEAEAAGFAVKITPFALILRAAVLALRRYPTLNARITRGSGDDDHGTIELLEHIHLGVAADTDRGLVVPNIKDAHTRSTLELALELNRLAAAAREGTLTPDELTGGTFTVNNYGAFGNDDGGPIINHPEAALLGIGAVRPRPWVVTDEDGEDQLAIRHVGRFTLAFDHRICDGGEAGRFVTEIATLCEQPGRLLLHL